MDNSTPQSRFQRELDKNKESRLESGEITLRDVADVLSLTIKDDDSNKKIVFLCMLSAYTEDSQINVSLNAPSSTGKTYLAQEVAKLFPKEDKIEKSNASPTSFFYEDGEVNPVTKQKIVDLERKILLFYEMPNPLLQEKLRALMSHDAKELHYSLTNKNKGRNKTDQIVVRGYSATIFCSAGLRLDEQEATRAILLSPEATRAKLLESIKLRVKRGVDAAKFDEEIFWNYDRQMLMSRIVSIRNERINHILIPNGEDIERKFLDIVGVLKPRHQRDIAHLMELIKVIALLNLWHRRGSTGQIIASQSDIDQGFELWQEFFESQNLNVSPVVLKFYKKYIVPSYVEKFAKAKRTNKTSLFLDMVANRVGLSSQELSNCFRETEGTSLNGEQLRKEILPQLANAGLIEWEKPTGEDEDKRSRHIFPLLLTDENKVYIGLKGVENKPLDLQW
jgi:AraC-like DNA-binding protein